MIIFAQYSKKDERYKENQPPQIHGGVQGEGGLGGNVGEPDAARTVQQVPTQPQPDQLLEEAAELSDDEVGAAINEVVSMYVYAIMESVTEMGY